MSQATETTCRLQTDYPRLNQVWDHARETCELHESPMVILEYTNQRRCLMCLYEGAFLVEVRYLESVESEILLLKAAMPTAEADGDMVRLAYLQRRYAERRRILITAGRRQSGTPLSRIEDHGR